MDFTEFFTLDYISSFAGMVVITMLIVQFFKDAPFIKDISTKYFAFVVALLNMVMCNILMGTFKLSSIYLIIINAIIITITATKSHDFIKNE